MKNEFKTPNGTITYEIQSHTITLLSYTGNEYYLSIPDKIENLPITAIAPKAFLGNKKLEKLDLPKNVTSIGDWAFSHMTNLKRISLPHQDITFGKQVFLDCPMLTQIAIQNTSDEMLSFYLASSYLTIKDFLLFRPADAGTDHWYEEFDRSLCRFLSRPDDEGFEPVFLGWFEDEDVMATQHPQYVKKIRLEKAALTLRRLRFPNALNTSVKTVYEEYLRTHMNPGVWDCILSPDFIDDIAYLQILTDLACIDENNLDSCLSDLNQHHATEAVAYLLQYKNSLLNATNFFDDLTL